MKRYRLLKELPTFHAGDIFTLGEDGCLYLTEPCDFNHHWKSRVMAYHKNTLSSFPNILEDWFEEIESSGYWYIDFDGDVLSCVEPFDDETEENRKQIGNYFETKEEAEKAVEKLKAWKRLKDKGFRLTDYDVAEPVGDGEFCGQAFFRGGNYGRYEIRADLDLLFGGEE